MNTPASLESLFLRFRTHGDARALASVFDRTAPELGRVACYLAGGDPHRAEDLLQTTWLSAMTHAERWDSARPLVPWLLGVLANHARSAQRASRRHAPGAEQLEVLLASDDPVRSSLDGEFAQHLANALAQLPSPFREAVGLHVQHGLTAVEIGATLGRPAGTVRTQIVRGLDRLRALLPIGLAVTAGAAMLSAGRLAAMRDVLVDHVPASTTASSAHHLLRWVAVAATVAVVATLAWIWSPERSTPLVAAGSVAVAPAEAGEPPPAQLGERAAVELPRPQVEPPRATPPARRAITVHVRHDDQPDVQLGELVGLIEGDDVRFLATDERGDVTFEHVGDQLVFQVFVSGTQTHDTWMLPRDPGEFAHEMTLQVPAGKSLEVTVVDAVGSPVAGAEVDGNGSQFANRRWCPLGVTAADGVLRLRSQVERPQLRARAAGHAVSRWRGVEDGGAASRCRLTLEAPGPQLRGRVVDEHGKPIAAELGTIAFASDLVEPWYDRTAADGTFVLDWLPLGHVAVVARARRGDDLRIGMVRVDLPSSAAIELRVDGGASLRGMTKFADGAPGGGSQVSLRLLADGAFAWPFAERTLRSWGRGEFVCAGLLPGHWSVKATIGDAEVAANFELPGGRTTTWDAVPPPLLPMRVRLRDERGDALVDWRVQVCDARGNGLGSAVPTDADGLTWESMSWRLPADRPLELAVFDAAAHALHPGFPVWRVPAIVPDGNLVEVTVPAPCRSTHTIGGLVVDESGQPLRASVMVVSKTIWWDGPEVTCDANGRFAIGPFAPGRATVVLTATGRPARRLHDVQIPATGDLDLGTIPMGPAKRVRAVAAGDVASPADLQLVLVAAQGGESFDLRRHGDGSFGDPAIPAGDYLLRGSSSAYRVATTPVQVGGAETTEIRFALLPAPLLRVVVELDHEQRAQVGWSGHLVVRGANGEPLLERGLETLFHGRVGEELVFEVAVPAGECTVELGDSWGMRRRERVCVDDGGGRVTFVRQR